MNKPDFANLLGRDKYQVFLMHSICNFPAWFAPHYWLVINEKGNATRYEGRFVINRDGKTIHKDAFGLTEGLGVFGFQDKPRWPSRMDYHIGGDEGSPACRMVNLIKGSERDYPFINKSKATGPNSNTYIKWILDQVPEFEAKLPWNAVGKGYRVKK
jgi:hypothetical protein